MRTARIVASSALLVSVAWMGGTSSASGGISALAEAAELRQASVGQILEVKELGTTVVTVARDSAGTYSVADVKAAPFRAAYLVRGNLLTGATNATSAQAWVPGDASTRQSVPLAVAAALPAGCSHWMLGPFGSYGYMVGDSATSCNANQILLQNSVNLYANNATTSLDFDSDQNVLVNYLASRATHLCANSNWTSWRASSSGAVNYSNSTTRNSGWVGRSCGY